MARCRTSGAPGYSLLKCFHRLFADGAHIIDRCIENEQVTDGGFK
jgi:hypothetical protein